MENVKKVVNQVAAWLFKGENWKNETKARVSEIFGKYMELGQPEGFDTWLLYTDGADWVMAKRSTWSSMQIGGTWDCLEKDLAEAYQVVSDMMLRFGKDPVSLFERFQYAVKLPEINDLSIEVLIGVVVYEEEDKLPHCMELIQKYRPMLMDKINECVSAVKIDKKEEKERIMKSKKDLIFPQTFIEAATMDIIKDLNGLSISAASLQSSYFEEEEVGYVKVALDKLVESGWLVADPDNSGEEKYKLSEAAVAKMLEDRNYKKFW